jgi:hypothetical protein
MSMIASVILASLFVALAVVAASARFDSGEADAPAHVRNTFEFTVGAPRAHVAPLFGANRERVWAEDWDPQFLHPQPAADRAGAVFTLQHGDRQATWITTVFEPEAGRIQHVYVIPDAMATLIDIRIASPDSSSTHVVVTYERTALSPGANARVRHLGDSDAASAPHWKKAIEAFLAKGE